MENNIEKMSDEKWIGIKERQDKLKKFTEKLKKLNFENVGKELEKLSYIDILDILKISYQVIPKSNNSDANNIGLQYIAEQYLLKRLQN